MKQDPPQPLEYARPAEPTAHEMKVRRARQKLVSFIVVVAVGTVLRTVAAWWSEPLSGLATLVIIVGSVGAAWWASVLFDLGGSGRRP